jgi:photosystem II stability/assembly factor-like uncharacterized protein
MAPLFIDMKILLTAISLASLGPVCGAPPQMIGPFGGSAAIVQIDPLRPGGIVAATSNAMLFQSTDSGEAWTRLRFPAELRSTLHAFAIAPQTGLYVAGLASDDHEYSGIFLSGDEGQSWSHTLPNENVWSIAIWPADPNVIAAGAEDGIFLTRDSGEHWSRISPESNPALMPVVSLEFDPVDRMILYAGTPHLPWKTTDGGQTWQGTHTGMLDDSDIFSIRVDLGRRSRVFVSACSGLYRSVNQGLSWTKLTGASGASYRTYQIVQHPTLLNLWFAGTTRGLVRSTDGGATWRKISAHATRFVAFDPRNARRIYVATDDSGLLRSDDLGDTMNSINEGFCNRHMLSLAALGRTLYASSPSGSAAAELFRNTDTVETWEKIDSLAPWGGQQVLKIVPLDPTHLYLLTSKTVLLSSDAGHSWMTIGPPATTRLTALLARAGGRRLVVGTETEIYYTEDGGQTWREARSAQGQFAIRSLVALGPRAVAALAGPSVLVAGDDADFEAVASPAAGAEIHALIATDGAELLAATSRGLKRSQDFGATWSAVSGVLDGNTVSAICKHPTRPGVLFAAGYGSIFSSVDDGRTWEPLTSTADRLPPIREMVIASGIPDSLFAITPAQGVYYVRLKPHLAWTECRNRICGTVRIQVP